MVHICLVHYASRDKASKRRVAHVGMNAQVKHESSFDVCLAVKRYIGGQPHAAALWMKALRESVVLCGVADLNAFTHTP